MGTHLSKNKLDPPSIHGSITSFEIYSVIIKTFKPIDIRIAEHYYDIYSLMDLKRFLEYVVEERFYHPANNSALLMMARERLWYAEVAQNPGSTLGYLAGDIVLPNNIRLNEANFYIDLEHRIWIVDPYTGKVYPPGQSMQIDFALL